MKSFFTIALIAGIVYLSSCNNKTDNLTPVPMDSVSKGSYLQLSFGSKNFNIVDLSVNNSPVYTIVASTIATDQYDTLWDANLVETDHKSTQMSLSMRAFHDSVGITHDSSGRGVYHVLDNNSTLTDHSTGQNRVYTILPGSTMTVQATGNYYIQGYLNLRLKYNYDTSLTASGNFKYYR
jgi:hypothetical protein